MESDNVLKMAQETIVERVADYGEPEENLENIAAVWAALMGYEYTGPDVAAMMVAMKLVRHRNRPKRDNWIDIAGYAHCGDQCEQSKLQERMVQL